MKAAKNTARTGAVSVVNKAGEPLPADDPPAKRRHLEGWRYWVIYMPAMIVATCLVFIFVDAVERNFYGDD